MEPIWNPSFSSFFKPEARSWVDQPEAWASNERTLLPALPDSLLRLPQHSMQVSCSQVGLIILWFAPAFGSLTASGGRYRLLRVIRGLLRVPLNFLQAKEYVWVILWCGRSVEGSLGALPRKSTPLERAWKGILYSYGRPIEKHED